jgi:hypothetical protein
MFLIMSLTLIYEVAMLYKLYHKYIKKKVIITMKSLT